MPDPMAGLTFEQARFQWDAYRAIAATRVQKRRTLSVLKQIGIVALAGVGGLLFPGIPWWGRLGLGLASGLVDDPSWDAAGLGIASASPVLTGVSRAVVRQIRSRDMPEADRPSFYGDIAIPALLWVGTKYGREYNYWTDWSDRWFSSGGPYVGDVGVYASSGQVGLWAPGFCLFTPGIPPESHIDHPRACGATRRPVPHVTGAGAPERGEDTVADRDPGICEGCGRGAISCGSAKADAARRTWVRERDSDTGAACLSTADGLPERVPGATFK